MITRGQLHISNTTATPRQGLGRRNATWCRIKNLPGQGWKRPWLERLGDNRPVYRIYIYEGRVAYPEMMIPEDEYDLVSCALVRGYEEGEVKEGRLQGGKK